MTDDAAVEDFLAHHGVLGMHWGVHNDKTNYADYEKKRLREIDQRKRKVKRGVNIGAGVYSGYKSGNKVANFIFGLLKGSSSDPGSALLFSVTVGATAGIIGGRVVTKFLSKHGPTKVNDYGH